jgi:hypothetical protein
MRKQFCCDASRGLYHDYYLSQAGNGGNVFHGARTQRGHGLGSILSGFFRSAMPLLKRGLAFFGKEALRTGARIATDVADGQKFGESAKRRVKERINDYAPGLVDQFGSGKRRRRIKKKKKSTKRRRHDIFGN